MGQNFDYAFASLKAGKKSSDQGCVEDLANTANSMVSRGFRLVSSVYDSRKKLTFLFFERSKNDEED